MDIREQKNQALAEKTARSYEEMNAWKREYLKQITAQGGIKRKFN
jgi:hypothetical protein